ncbi:hypothetical protein ACETRX_03945 [Labrys portucalensis]|uniref:C4-type zinc ribbon domain-containing protein n=1 Tax=Labrys neptuniae TaxID=376174 RepID=A0ABV6Z976_9HYPH
MPIVETIQAVTAAMTAVKELRAMEKQYDEAVFKLKIAELMGSLADAKTALVDTQDEIRAKDDEIARLKASFERHKDTVENRGDVYFAHEGRPTGLPLCRVCLMDGILIEQTRVPRRDGVDNQCPKCKTIYRHNLGFPYKDER